MTATKAKIFLAEERGITEADWYRSYNTFSFGQYYNESKLPAAALQVCNDDTLAGGRSFILTADADILLIIVPLVGGVNFIQAGSAVITINAGEVFSIYLNEGETFELGNPGELELVNFLQYWIRVPQAKDMPGQLLSFDIDAAQNSLVYIPALLPLHMAKLEGRKELVYTPTNSNSCVFAFVIQGAFEMEGILLQSRDGAAFWNYPKLETEALSAGAIILLLEMNGG